MSDDRMPDLDEELRDLFDAEQRRPGLDEEASRRLLEGVRARIGPGAGGDGGDGGPGGGAPTVGPGGPAAGGSILRSAAWLPLTTFVVGALVGATLHAAFGSMRPTERVQPEAVVPGPSAAARWNPTDPAPTAGSQPIERTVASQTVTDSPMRHDVRPPLPERAYRFAEGRGEGRRPRNLTRSEAAPSDDLEHERAIVERARTALLRGEPSRAIEALRQHQRTFPSGQLAEERDALRVQALAAAGRQQEARDESARFRREHPESILSPEAE